MNTEWAKVRKIAREAVIFALLGQLFATVGIFCSTVYINHNLIGSTLESLFFGLWGFLVGLGLWVFYRLVRFAVMG